jgi:hypothetical protein
MLCDLTSLLCVLVLAQNKDKPPPKPEPKLIPIARIVGKLEQSGETGTLKLRVPIQKIEPNVQAQQELIQKQQQWTRRQWEIMRNPNPFQRYQQMVQLYQEVQQAQQNLFVVKESHVDIDFEITEELKVRNSVPMPGFDEMGNVRKLTPELAKELKGKENLPGYQGERTDLKNGQTVLVIAARDRASKDPMAKPIAALVLILLEPRE